MSTAIYTRISKDHAGLGLGVARQEKACRELADQRGWNNAVVFSDNDVSASRAVRRPQYEAMLAGVRAGTVRRIVVWDLDRLSRQPIELEGFIDLVEQRGVELANVSGEVDLSTAHGRMFARIKGRDGTPFDFLKAVVSTRSKDVSKTLASRSSGSLLTGKSLSFCPMEREAISGCPLRSTCWRPFETWARKGSRCSATKDWER